MTQHNSRLLIVYNADSGIINALMHAVHKQVRPETYPCSLCALTYGLVSMRGRWRSFLNGLRMEKVFLHKDEFARSFPGHSIPLPAVLFSENGHPPQILVGAEHLDTMQDVDELIDVVEQKLQIERPKVAPLRAVA